MERDSFIEAVRAEIRRTHMNYVSGDNCLMDATLKCAVEELESIDKNYGNKTYTDVASNMLGQCVKRLQALRTATGKEPR